MEELKTLKDLENEQIKGFDSKLKTGILPSRYYCWTDELKAEAVKWAKRMNDDDVDEHAITSFMNFFNLTEEDLE